MEDFLGRGDRKLSKVIEEALREGAGMDAWFESLEHTYKAWTKAISNVGFEGSNRKLALGSHRYRSQQSITRKRVSKCFK